MSLIRACLAILALLIVSAPAMAWGPQGHRIVGDLAERQLTPAAHAEVQRLLAGEAEPTLAGVANWADEMRTADPDRFKKTSRWHYVNFPHGDCGFVPPRDCPDGNCVIAAINRNFLALADHSRPDAERRDALKFLVHFIGDVHQPLHAGYDDDRGGNDFQINIDGEGWNLHSIWDSMIIKKRGLDPVAYAQLLSKQSPLPSDPTRFSDRPAVDWAVESCKIVHDGNLYPAKHVLKDDYLNANRPLVEQRLRRAGSRLAAMINYALAPTAK